LPTLEFRRFHILSSESADGDDLSYCKDFRAFKKVGTPVLIWGQSGIKVTGCDAAAACLRNRIAVRRPASVASFHEESRRSGSVICKILVACYALPRVLYSFARRDRNRRISGAPIENCEFDSGTFPHMLDDITPALERCRVFSEARSKTRTILIQFATRRTLRGCEILVEQGVDWPYLGLLIDGNLVGISTTGTGREHALFEVGVNQTFGEPSIDGNPTLAKFLSAGRAARVILFPRDIIKACMKSDGEFAEALALVCVARVRGLAERLEDRISKPTITRLASMLLSYATPGKGLGPAHESLRFMTQSQLATAAGTVKEVAARDIARLRAAGAISCNGGRIVGIDSEKLRSCATAALNAAFPSNLEA